MMYWYLSFKSDMDEAKTVSEARRALADIESFVSDSIDEMSNRQSLHIAASSIAALADWSWNTKLEVKATPVMREIYERMCYRIQEMITEVDLAETMLSKCPKEAGDEQ